MYNPFRKRKNENITYPRQFWLLFWGVLINRASASMLWPFLIVYMKQQLDLPLATITLLLTIRAVASIISTTVVSDFMDRFGRKNAMLGSVIASSVVFAGMVHASDFASWALLIAAHGTVIPIFNIGVNAMVADVVPRVNRAPAYALIRTISNAGIAVGPVIGGILASISFAVLFYLTAGIFLIVAALIFIFLQETNPARQTGTDSAPPVRGYGVILSDWLFLSFFVAFLITSMAYSQVFSLLPIYTVDNFGLSETEYSLFLTVNAGMVVLLQYAVTKFTDRFRPYTVIAVGALVYALGLYSIIFGSTLLHFCLSMAIITLGELIFSPTTLTLVADMAPDTMRARYLGLLSLGYPVGSGIGPVIGGFLNDTIAPVAIWYGAGTMALCGFVAFLVLARIYRQQQTDPAVP